MKKPYFKSLMIEPTNICNLHCPVCPTGSDFRNNTKGSIKLWQFKKIIDTTKDFLEDINLWGFGEPFLTPNIMKMINYAGKNKILINVHTNGTVLNKKMINRFEKNHKMLISFSVDGLTQEAYSYYRRGGNLKTVLNNLSYLVNFKKRYNLFNLFIVWQFLITRINECQVPKVIKFAQNIGVDRLRLKTINISKNNPRYNDFIPRNKTYRQTKSKVLIFRNCNKFIDPGTPTVSWDGDVVPCCHDYHKEHIMGNLFLKSIIDIWNSQKYKKFRDDYKKGVNDFCNTKCRFTKKSEGYLKEINF